MSLLPPTTEKIYRKRQWPKHRKYRESGCDCNNCAKTNDICSSCMDWSCDVKLHLCCNSCANAYHKDCLDDDELEPYSWYECDELGPDYECHQGPVIRFKWLQPSNVRNMKNEIKYWKKRHGKEWDLSHALKFYQSFSLNNKKYKIDDYVQIKAENDKNEEIMAAGRIINIYLSKDKEALMVIEYFWKISEHPILFDQYGENNDYYLFEESGKNGWYIMHDIEISSIIGKIKICSSVNECIEWRTKIEKNQRRIQKSMERNECINIHNQRCPEINAYFLFNGSFNSKTGTIEIIEIESNKVKIKKEIKREYDDYDDSDDSDDDEQKIESKAFIKDQKQKPMIIPQKHEINTSGSSPNSSFDDEYLSGFSDIMASSDDNLPTSDYEQNDESEETEFLNIEGIIPEMNKINVKEQKEEILLKPIKDESDSESSDIDYDFIEIPRNQKIKQSVGNHNKNKTWEEFQKNIDISTSESDDDYDFVEIGIEYKYKNKKPLKSALRRPSDQNNQNQVSKPKKVRFNLDNMDNEDNVEEEDYDDPELKQILKTLSNKLSEQIGNIKIHQNKINEQKKRTVTTTEQYLVSTEELKNKKQEINEWNECDQLLMEMVKNVKNAEIEKKRKEMDDERNINQDDLNGEGYCIGRGDIYNILQKWDAQ